MYQDDAFTEVIDRGGTEDVAPGLKRPIVVIGGDFFEGEVIHAVWSENGGEASFGGIAAVAGGEVIVVVVVLGRKRELEFGYSIKDSGLKSLQLC